MKVDLSKRLPEEIQAKIQKHSSGAESLEPHALECHYCGYKTIIAYDDLWGHLKAKCRKCRKEAIYNVALCRGVAVRYRIP